MVAAQQTKSTVGDLNAAYDLFRDTENITIDYILMGPCGVDAEATKMKNKAIKVKKVLSNLPIISVGFVSNP